MVSLLNFNKIFCIILLKRGLMALFEDFNCGTLPLHNLNFRTIILVPKTNEAKQIQQYRLMCLLNVSFKIFTKVATNRVTSVVFSRSGV